MRCAQLQALLCEYVEGALSQPERLLVERHIESCPVCAAMVRDAAAALALLRSIPELEPPAHLVNRILFQIPRRPATASETRTSPAGWLISWLRPLLQPRFAMGMAMTMLSFSMLARFAGIGPRQLSPMELSPVRLWQTLEDTAHRTWERARKFYLSLRLVYEIQTQLHEWSQQLREEGAALAPPPERGTTPRPEAPNADTPSGPAGSDKGTGESEP